MCDPAETCDGVGDDCPADGKSTSECRGSAGVCDPAETCDGVGDDCPADGKSTSECRSSTGVCDPAETCDGVGDACPADVFAPDGTACTDADVCTSGDQCTGGMCLPTGSITTCTDGDGCCPAGCAGPEDDDCGLAGIGVVGKKLVVVDKLTAASKAKLVFVSKDGAAGITKGAGTDADAIAVDFALAYANGSAAGSFVLPAGASDGTAGWVVNKTAVAKYVNKGAPGGPTQAKVAVIKPNKLLKLVGKGLGDTQFDILGGGDPAGSVYTAYCVTNGAEEHCHCSEFTGCVYKSIAAETGAKLTCKVSVGDPTCAAL